MTDDSPEATTERSESTLAARLTELEAAYGRRIDQLEGTVSELTALLGQRNADVLDHPEIAARWGQQAARRIHGPTPFPEGGASTGENASDEPTAFDRRRLLSRAGTAAVGAVIGGAAASIAAASPAAAATGSFDTSTSTPAVDAVSTGTGPGVRATAPQTDADLSVVALDVQGRSRLSGRVVVTGDPDSKYSNAVLEVKTTTRAPAIETMAGPGSYGSALDAWGIVRIAVTDTSSGYAALTINSASPRGGIDCVASGASAFDGKGRDFGGIFTSDEGIGANGHSVRGVGGSFSGGRAALRLDPQDPDGNGIAPPRSTAVAHELGSLVVDQNGDLWLCTADGTPGTWVRLAGPGSAGSFTVLPAPVRVYDSRPGNPPTDVGPKTPLAARVPRSGISVTANGSGVPTDATAAMVSATVTRTTGGTSVEPAFLSLYASGPWPGTSNLNWTTTGATIAVTTVVPLAPGATLTAYASNPTDLILDVLGYYR